MLVIGIYAPLEHPLMFRTHLSINLYIYLLIHAFIFNLFIKQIICFTNNVYK